MMSWFRCTHKKKSLPITRRRKDNEINRLADTYVVCLSCGEKIPYSFSESRVLQERRKTNLDGNSVPGFQSLA
jgi:hypothetical protein